MAGFKAIAEAPRFLSRQDADVAQQSTPGSFAALPPLLRLELDQVRIYLCPPPDSLPTCFSKYESTLTAGQHANPDGEDEDLDQDAAQTVVADGKLWLTESELSFLAPGSSSGFSVTYPTISLHAVTRSPPAGLAAPCPPSASASQQNGQDPRSGGCLYVQLDLAAEDEQADQDDEGSLLEMHVFTPDDESLDQLFEALSHCASLHPSAGGGGDGGSHPFSGFAPFGTGDPDAMAVDGAFDDADEDDDAVVADAQPTNGNGAGTAELSEAGRKKLAHLDSVMVWPDSEDGEDYDDDDDDDERDGATRRDLVDAVSALASTMTTSGGLEDAEGEPTNTLILRNLPVEFFVPSICSALLSLLNAYGTLVRWIPMPTVGRAVVVFEEVEGARLAKGGLDRLLLPFEETGQDDGAVSEGPDGPLRVDEDARAQADDSILRAVYGPTVSSDEAEASTLSVPTTDKNFLISPPGSPPVGWEPIREDPPNRDTLADDLMRALGELRDTQRHIESHQPTDWGKASQDDVRDEAQDGCGSGVPKSLRAVPAPEVILAPSMAPALRSYQPAWLRGGGGGGGGSSSSSKSNTAGLAHQLQPNSSSGDGKEGDDDDELIQVPGVTVQSFDPVEDGEGPKTHLGFTISSVKATVDSMRSPTLLAQQGHASDVPALNVGGGLGEAGVGAGGYGGSKRITPTSRPPLSD